MAVLHKSADGFGGVHDFECVQWRSQRGHDLGLGHWKIDRSELHQRVTAGQEVGRIHVGHGASGGDIHIATHQDGADGRTRFKPLRLFGVADRTDSHYRHDSRRCKLRSELFQRSF